MTPGQRRWLEKLLHDGRRRRPRYGALPCAECQRKGWTEGFWVDDGTGGIISSVAVISRKFEGVHVEDSITDAGRAALACLK